MGTTSIHTRAKLFKLLALGNLFLMRRQLME
jgi:hypothetical protein